MNLDLMKVFGLMVCSMLIGIIINEVVHMMEPKEDCDDSRD